MSTYRQSLDRAMQRWGSVLELELTERDQDFSEYNEVVTKRRFKQLNQACKADRWLAAFKSPLDRTILFNEAIEANSPAYHFNPKTVYLLAISGITGTIEFYFETNPSDTILDGNGSIDRFLNISITTGNDEIIINVSKQLEYYTNGTEDNYEQLTKFINQTGERTVFWEPFVFRVSPTTKASMLAEFAQFIIAFESHFSNESLFFV